MNVVLEKIKIQINENPILLYIKGSPELPRCGFSAQAVQIIKSYGEHFSYIDVLKHPDIRLELPKYANWPTFPQLWIKCKFIGGCDIISDMHKQGKLKTLIKNAINEK